MKQFAPFASAETLFSVCGHVPPRTAFTRQHGIHTMMSYDQFRRWVKIFCVQRRKYLLILITLCKCPLPSLILILDQAGPRHEELWDPEAAAAAGPLRPGLCRDPHQAQQSLRQAGGQRPDQAGAVQPVQSNQQHQHQPLPRAGGAPPPRGRPPAPLLRAWRRLLVLLHEPARHVRAAPAGPVHHLQVAAAQQARQVAITY